MSLSNINLIFLAVAIIAIGLAFRFLCNKNKLKTLNCFGNEHLQSIVVDNFTKYKKHLKYDIYFLFLFLTLLAFAVLRPQFGWTLRDNQQKGIDIVIAIDVSQSMLASDIFPNRLQVAKHIILDFLNTIQNDRVSLVAFAGTAFIETPLTSDLTTFRQFLNSLNTNLIPVPGTNFEIAFLKVIEAFSLSENKAETNIKKNRAVFLLTDGEELTGNLNNIKHQLNTYGIKTFILGMGTKNGAPIPTQNGSYKKDKDGNVIISKLNGDFLEQLARETNGIYIPALTSSNLAGKIYKQMKSELTDDEFETGKIRVKNEFYQLPIALAMLLLLLPAILIRTPFHKYFFKTVTLFLLITTNAYADSKLQQQAQEKYYAGDFETAGKEFADILKNNPNDYKSNLALGNSLYRQNNFIEAEKYFAKASEISAENPIQNETALYNLANSQAQQRKYPEAIENYENILKINPQNNQAKKNLEIVKKLLKQNQEQEQDNQQRCQNDQQQNQEDKDKQQEDNQEKEEGKDQQNQDQLQGNNQNSSDNEEKKNPKNQNQSGKDESEQERQDSSSQATATDNKNEQKEGKNKQQDIENQNESKQDNNNNQTTPTQNKNDNTPDIETQSAIAGEALLNALKENKSALNEFRKMEALRQLKQYNNGKLPDKDW